MLPQKRFVYITFVYFFLHFAVEVPPRWTLKVKAAAEGKCLGASTAAIASSSRPAKAPPSSSVREPARCQVGSSRSSSGRRWQPFVLS